MPHNSNNRWLIVFLIYADFRLSTGDREAGVVPMNGEMKAALDLMFSDILNTPVNSDKARLFVLLNGISYKKPEANDDSPVEDKTLLYTIVNSGTGEPNKIGRVELLDSDDFEDPGSLGKNPFQRPKSLKTILSKRLPPDPDEEVVLITWDHGSAFGIFRDVMRNNVLPMSSIYCGIDDYPYLKKFWSAATEKYPAFDEFATKTRKTPFYQVGGAILNARSTGNSSFVIDKIQKPVVANINQSEDNINRLKTLALFHNKEKNNFVLSDTIPESAGAVFERAANLTEEKVSEILSNHELSEVIAAWLENKEVKKLGVLIMMNCWMMNLHTMYSLQNTVQCLVAPQSDIGSPGYNYKEVLEYAFSDTGVIDPRELAKVCVKSAENDNNRERAELLRKDIPNIIDSWKIFAADLEQDDGHGKNLLSQQIDALNNFIVQLNQFSDRVRQRQQHEHNRFKEDESKFLFKFVRAACFDFSGSTLVMIVDIVTWALAVLNAEDDFQDFRNRILDDKMRRAFEKFWVAFFENGNKRSLFLNFTKGIHVYNLGDDKLKIGEKPRATIGLEPTGYSLFFPLFKYDAKEYPRFENILSLLHNDSLLIALPGWKQFLQDQIDKEIDY
jgi:hypothetical protein